jgi:hypothetical protein
VKNTVHNYKKGFSNAGDDSRNDDNVGDDSRNDDDVGDDSCNDDDAGDDSMDVKGFQILS